MILCITCYSCDDPYKDTVFKVYDVQPAATYLQNRPDDFSEWVKVFCQAVHRFSQNPPDQWSH